VVIFFSRLYIRYAREPYWWPYWISRWSVCWAFLLMASVSAAWSKTYTYTPKVSLYLQYSCTKLMYLVVGIISHFDGHFNSHIGIMGNLYIWKWFLLLELVGISWKLICKHQKFDFMWILNVIIAFLCINTMRSEVILMAILAAILDLEVTCILKIIFDGFIVSGMVKNIYYT
jgi:hypothetical protein